MKTNVTLRAAEWVLPGHPDKLADAISDSVLDALFARFCIGK